MIRSFHIKQNALPYVYSTIISLNITLNTQKI
nr:MAG TPA: hypothetical protein [Caudoviricetes sp.]